MLLAFNSSCWCHQPPKMSIRNNDIIELVIEASRSIELEQSSDINCDNNNGKNIISVALGNEIFDDESR